MSRETIKDVIFVYSLEKRLGEKLTPAQLDGRAEIDVWFPQSGRTLVDMKWLSYPYDLMSVADDPAEDKPLYESIIETAEFLGQLEETIFDSIAS